MTRRALCLALFLGVILGLPACTRYAPDPGATRTETQSKELRERMMTVQTDR